ncbi:Ferredoxin [Candidatus Tiddalikarchaeum anstoanum]|nr:Ferredoxin [Candidatus Tiddalikarchaeum anstoanum]
MAKQEKFYRIIVNREKCNGCGICVKVCPGNWEILDDEKAHAIKIKLKKIGQNISAMQYCPRGAIKIVDAR